MSEALCCTFKLYPLIISELAEKAGPNDISSAQLLRLFISRAEEILHEDYVEPPRRGRKKMVNFRLTESLKAKIVSLATEWERNQSDIIAILIHNGQLRTELYLSRRS